MRFGEDFVHELKSRLRPSDVIGKHVQLKKSGREWSGLSPFTQEKTPSFFVNDEKGFFHCFSSGKHGDIINFLQEVQGLSFPEAVERLAEEARLPLPKADPQTERIAGRRKRLGEAVARAAEHFQACLRRAEGAQARRYAADRGLTENSVRAFGLGYAPKTRTDLLDYLINKGFSKEELEEAGLATRLEDGGLIDKFRDRLMFPILNASGKPIAFGGRALNPAARAKYLNSPETPLFHKGDVLYNVAAARAACAGSGGQTHPLLVCEGYMDVIALSQAGFPAAVAPLGTALTERQIEMLWTAADEPILCFDGDRAGQAAAYRAVDRALPLLKPGKSLRFAFLPDGLDPDDLIRARGPAAFRAVLEAARSMDAVIWEREAAAAPLSTPERRAGFRSRLRALVARIADPDVRAAYGAAFKHRFNREDEAPASRERWRGSHRTSPSRSSERPAPGPTPELRLAASSLAARQPARMREALIVAAVLNHPELVERFGEEIADLRLQEPRFDHLLRDLIDASLTAERLDSAQARIHLLSRNHAATIDELDADARLRLERFCQGGADIETAEAGVRVVLDQRLLWDVLPAEIEEAKADLAQDLTEAALARLNNLLNHQAALAKTLGCGGG